MTKDSGKPGDPGKAAPPSTGSAGQPQARAAGAPDRSAPGVPEGGATHAAAADVAAAADASAASAGPPSGRDDTEAGAAHPSATPAARTEDVRPVSAPRADATVADTPLPDAAGAGEKPASAPSEGQVLLLLLGVAAVGAAVGAWGAGPLARWLLDVLPVAPFRFALRFLGAIDAWWEMLLAGAGGAVILVVVALGAMEKRGIA